MNNVSYSFFGLVCSVIGLSKAFISKIEVINIKKSSASNLLEYEELS